MGGPGSGRPRELSNKVGSVPQVDSSPDPKAKTPAKPAAKRRAPARKPAKSLTVRSPGGTEMVLQSTDEVAYYQRLSTEYAKEFAFDNFSDLEALGRIIYQETLSHRYASCLAKGQNINGDVLSPAQESDYRKALTDASRQLSVMKSELGMHLSQRKDQSESPQQYMVEVLRRAKIFGVTREKQSHYARVKFNELMSNVEAFDRSNKVEREHLGFESEKDLVDWVRKQFDGYREIDRAFVAGEQRYWTEPKNV